MKEEVKTKYTIPRLYEEYAKLAPDKPVIIYGDKEISWKELDERSNQLANALLDLGVKREDKVPFGSYNSPYWYESYFALNKIAATFTNLNYRYKEQELYYVIDNSDATAIIITEDLVERIEHIRPDLKKVGSYIVIGKKENTPDDMLNYDDLVKKYPKTKPKLDWTPMTEDDHGWFLYTGGTTGYPKAAVGYTQRKFVRLIPDGMHASFPYFMERLSDGLPKEVFSAIEKLLNIPGSGTVVGSIFNSSFVSSLLKTLSRYPSIVIPLADRLIPLFLHEPRIMRFITPGRLRMMATTAGIHAWGWGSLALGPLFGGCSVVPTSKHFNADEILDLIERKKVNVISVIGDATVRPLVDVLEKKHYDIGSLLAIVNGGATVSADVKRDILRYIPNALFVDTLMATDNFWMSGEIYTSAGKDTYSGRYKITPDMKIVDENYNFLGVGEEGFIAMKSDIMPGEWYKDPERSKKTFVTIKGERWNISGDMAYVDEDGYIHFVGRGSECINTGGQKVYPEEVEKLIKSDPRVNYVAITAIPDKKWGEAIVAVVELKRGEKASKEEITDFCRGKIAGYKVPKHVVFVDELPLTSVYKPYYKEIKELARKKLVEAD